MVVGLGELIGDPVLGDEAGVVRTFTVEGSLVSVPAHGRTQHFAQERAVSRGLTFRARHHRVRDVTEQLTK
jgi:hypothetical protein